jgi:sugar O-acyltransferase (sialic acid O-acetyltransferase NeuD family)
MSKPVLVIGAGGHAAVLIEVLLELNHTIIGLVAIDKPENKPVFFGIPYYSSDEDVLAFEKDKVLLANGIGSLPGSNLRLKVHQKFNQLGYDFITVISPRAIVSQYSTYSEGVQVMPGAIVNANTFIGVGTILNTGAIVEHDCYIGPHNHIAPGVTLSGNVSTGAYVHIGTGACVIQSIEIGDNTVVGAGAMVNKNLASNKKLYVATPLLF